MCGLHPGALRMSLMIWATFKRLYCFVMVMKMTYVHCPTVKWCTALFVGEELLLTLLFILARVIALPETRWSTMCTGVHCSGSSNIFLRSCNARAVMESR